MIGLALFIGCPKPTPAPVIEAVPAESVRGQLPTEAGLAARPEDLPVEPLSYRAPDPGDYRHEVDGVPVWVATSREFPLVNIVLRFEGGTYLDPASQIGVGAMTGSLMRSGGSAQHTPESLDEQLAYLAADVSVAVGDTASKATLNCLTDQLDACVDLFQDMVREPRFDADRMRLYKDSWIARRSKRNDDAAQLMSEEWDALMFGRDHFLGRVPTQASIEGIGQRELGAFHKRVFHPGNLSVQISGDIDADGAKALVARLIDGWTRGERSPEPPAPTAVPEPGVYHVAKDIPQGKVRIGLPGIERDDGDAIAIAVMNDILGGGGFTSRITKRVRSDEGLAYTARSGVWSEVEFPGQIVAWTESKNETVALATDIMLEEIERIAAERVSESELRTAKAALVESFGSRFSAKERIVSVLDEDERTDRPDDHWATYQDRLAAVDADEVLRVSKRLLSREDTVILIVGDWESIARGDKDGRATMTDIHGGEVTHLPLRDPMTGEPLD